MWDWSHFKSEGWLAHTKRSAKFSGLLLLSGLAMVLHTIVPFWLQPKWLCADSVACALCEGMEKKDD
jgi:hypothetical protein